MKQSFMGTVTGLGFPICPFFFMIFVLHGFSNQAFVKKSIAYMWCTVQCTVYANIYYLKLREIRSGLYIWQYYKTKDFLMQACIRKSLIKPSSLIKPKISPKNVMDTYGPGKYGFLYPHRTCFNEKHEPNNSIITILPSMN